jgi:N-acylneuraminate cytidylyltransferase
MLGGKPLLAWSIEVAQAVEAITRIVVSTDDPAISRVAEEYGAFVARRPAHLATDGALVIDAVRYHIQEWQARGEPADIIVLLEPTCPLRRSDDVSECLRRLTEGSIDSVATFTDAALNPHRAWRIEDRHPEPFIEGAVPWRPRQSLPEAYQLNGGVYAFYSDRLPSDCDAPLFGEMDTVYMPGDRSVDIDSELDLKLAQLMLKNRKDAE